MTPSKILFFLCISFVLGIFLESIIKIHQIFIWGILFLAVLLIFSGFLPYGKKPLFNKIIIFGFCLLVLILGVLRTQISEFNIANNKLSRLNGQGPVILQGVIIDDPDVRDASQKLKIRVADGIILATTNKYPEYKYLDKIKFTGKLETPSETDEFSYKNYLLKDGIFSVMSFPKIEVLGKASASPYSTAYAGILFLKQKLRSSIKRNFSPPESLILQGTVLGDNGAMTSDLKSKLNITGLRHIIAVSGTHVVILSAILMSVLIAFGLWRGQAFYIAVIFIFIYVVLTGLPASGIRAGIMGCLFLLAQKLGRQSMGLRTIVLAGAVMLLQNPLLLIYDVGFQLSFLAVLGLIYIEPIIKYLIKIFTKDRAENIVSIISTTFAAQIFTLPIMIFNFGNISFVAPITNILVLPIVYYLMLFGFLSSVVGIFFNFLGWILSLPCYFLLKYFVWVIDVFSQPWMAATIKNVPPIWLFISYSIIGGLTRYLNKKYRQNFI